jgi:hypothetical protein
MMALRAERRSTDWRNSFVNAQVRLMVFLLVFVVISTGCSYRRTKLCQTLESSCIEACDFPFYKWVESGDSLEWKIVLDLKILSGA